MLTTVQRNNLQIGISRISLPYLVVVPEKYVSRLSHRECAEFVLRCVLKVSLEANMTTFSVDTIPQYARIAYDIEVSKDFSIRVWGSEGRPTMITFSTLLHKEEEGIEVVESLTEDDLKEKIEEKIAPNQ